ncbi:MAG: Sbal_3080 family lipoprotein [Azoarcus sp.]|jgi:hypothetical protein|nr:Sbal_3080 family lipoprotein [Azoarcus sp.]
MKKTVALLAAVTTVTACTSVDVTAVDPSLDMRHVCIQENPQVMLKTFIQVLEDGLARNGLTSETFSRETPPHCEFVLTYTALRAWDIGPYMSHAELVIWHNGKRLAEATYHLVGKGGFSLMKWQSTKTKIDPVIDQLFKGRRIANPVATTPRPAQVRPDPTMAPAPAPAALPAPVAEPVAVPAPKQEPGFYGHSASIVPEARACASAPAPVLTAKGGGAETYSIACDNGDVLIVRCEPGHCRTLK